MMTSSDGPLASFKKAGKQKHKLTPSGNHGGEPSPLMPDVLLDFPWNLDVVLDTYSPILGVLRDFNTLVSQHASTMVPVAFVAEDESARLWRQIGERPGSKVAFQHLRIFLKHCERH